MRLIRTFILSAALMLLAFAVAVPANAQGGRQVWAFYMGFWTGNGWGSSPEVMDDQPSIGLYDSRDAGVGGLQIDQAKGAGIDAFLVSWFGQEDGAVTTAVLNNLLDRAAERGFMVGAAVDIFDPNFNNARDKLIGSLSYLVNDRANHPGYLRYNGKPVIAFAFQSRLNFTAAQWQEIRNAVDPNHNTIWLAEGVSGCCLYGGAMDGMYAFNLAWANGSSSRYSSERNRVLRAGGTLYVPMVHPGWNENKIAAREGRPNPTSPKDRAGGQFLAQSFKGAVASGADVIMIGTWNEYVENSHIEPSNLYGTQSLDTLGPLVAAWKSGGSVNNVQSGGAAPAAQAVTPASGTLESTTNRLNVREGPGTNFTSLGRISPGTVYTITGQAGDWWVIDFGGRPGYVSAQYVRVTQ
jgi:hypothetical protein